eukprot:1091801-Prymnesium_polylepis.1
MRDRLGPEVWNDFVEHTNQGYKAAFPASVCTAGIALCWENRWQSMPARFLVALSPGSPGRQQKSPVGRQQ